jgi:hypothetical protein
MVVLDNGIANLLEVSPRALKMVGIILSNTGLIFQLYASLIPYQTLMNCTTT